MSKYQYSPSCYLEDHDDPEQYNDPVNKEKHQDSKSENDSDNDTRGRGEKELLFPSKQNIADADAKYPTEF